MARPYRWIAVAAAAVTAVGLTPLVSFADTPDPSPRVDVAPTLDLPAGVVAAMKRDLNLTDDQIAERLRTEAAAPVVQKRLKAKLGPAYGGAWIKKGDQRLTVAVTSEAAAREVRAEGAEAKVVARSESALASDRAKLDKRGAKAADTIRSWRVDPATNTVVVTVKPGAEAQARKFAQDSGVTKITVETSSVAPEPVYDVRGGDQYVINGNTLCSVGFAARRGGAPGFVTAGHCGGRGAPTRGFNNVDMGSFQESEFPNTDMAYVGVNGNWTPQPWVNNYSGGNVTVAGSNDAAIGSSICRSGRTSSWTCGTLQGRGETINYSNGPVYGMSRMSACANPGDSGGSVIAGNQAQGVTSGIAGGCGSANPQTWFQPVNPILSRWGIALVTTGGGSAGGALISALNGRCLDVPNGNFADGVRVQMWNCNNSAAQKWESVNGTLRTGNNKCLDVAWGSTANGAILQIVGCSGNPAQQWVLSAAGDLVNPQANKCADIEAWNPNDGATLVLWECHGGANQKWRR
ncbi:ricin-type beta-trefoil lectin domain protein [Actinoplanes sp. TRM 88003]|uniref:Ricin-type beta-trefoil lectin domain protein n=1 Tax=Paractinoplanes aksuensis TaxID=2939490 RepID=A0ABT1DZC8_9ACTN|nr:ricin-type beta-trefoil lectin domain protein [Actinoplanes aksuensis]MCO8276222.1 ricin-type beta-trefoil lectin domain protein [Actinoplanes aksuensis]